MKMIFPKIQKERENGENDLIQELTGIYYAKISSLIFKIISTLYFKKPKMNKLLVSVVAFVFFLLALEYQGER